MKFATLAFTFATMALGVSAGCKKTNDVCKSFVQAQDAGQTDPFACDAAEDLPCDTSCLTIGSREVDANNWEFLKCCKPSSKCP